MAKQNRWHSAILVPALLGSMAGLAYAMRESPTGTSYAVWVGIGAVGTAILAVILFGEPVNLMRAAGIALEEGAIDVERATGLLRLFLRNRWIGLWPILYGDQVRQTALDNWIFQGTLDVEHLPQPEQEVEL